MNLVIPPAAFPSPERGAALVAGLTLASRAMGLVRTAVMTGVLGVTYLGNAYATANTVPNIMFEIVAGGVLAAVLVPALAPAVTAGARQEIQRTSSALLNTTLLALTPVVVAGVLLRGPLMELLTSGVSDPAIREQQRRLGEFLLIFFLPQIWLYGVGTVWTGVLHAHNRFGPPALAPGLSSAVVTASYVLYAVVEGGRAGRLEAITETGRIILGAGTTAGVVVLSLSLVLPVRRLGIRWTRVVRVPREAARKAGALLLPAAVGVAGLQVLLGVVLVIANRVEGGVVAYQLAFTVLLLPWATLAVPIATAAYPSLAAWAGRDKEVFARICAETSRTASWLVFGGASLLFAVAAPLSRAILSIGIGGGVGSASVVTPTIAAFAPGLIGYGGYAVLTRIAFARGDGASAALGAAAGFSTAIVLNLIAASALSGRLLVAALAGSFSLGMAVGVGVLLYRVRGAAGPGAFEGLGATSARSLAAGVFAALVGVLMVRVLPEGGLVEGSVTTLATAGAAAAVYVLAQRSMGDKEMARALGALRRR